MPAERDAEELERAFSAAMFGIYEKAKRELGYNATRFLQMLSELGGRETAKRLLASPPSDGFTTLWEARRLDLTVEAHMILDEFEPLFSSDEREQARQRLEEAGWEAPAG